MMLYYDLLDTPIGVLTLIADADGALVRVNLPSSRKPPPDITTMSRDGVRMAVIRQQFVAYFTGARCAFELSLHPYGTVFQRQVWDGLLQIGYGCTTSYAQLAQRIGRPRAMRAVGAANGANPLAIVVPCHRVIGTDGSLTGYAGGVAAKRWLLEHEQRHVSVA